MSDTRPLAGYSEIIAALDALPVVVRETRRRKGLSLRAAADEIGMSYANIDRFERGLNSNYQSTVMPLLRWVAKP